MSIQRYYGQGGMLVPSPDGDVVMHADHLAEVENAVRDYATAHYDADSRHFQNGMLAEQQRIVEAVKALCDGWGVDPEVDRLIESTVLAVIEGDSA